MAKETPDEKFVKANTKKHKSKSFWTLTKIAIVAFFIIGFVLGVFTTNQIIDPALGLAQQSDYNALLTENRLCDSQLDSCTLCLQENDLDLGDCN